MMALTQKTPASVVDRVLEYRDRLRSARPRPSREVAFSLAAGIEPAGDAAKAGERSAGDLAALHTLRTILDVQQAAMAAAASSAASIAATAGSQ